MNKRGVWDFAEVFMMMLLVALVLLFFFVIIPGAEERQKAREAAEAAQKITVSNETEPKAEAENKRFAAKFYGKFYGGYDNNVRAIYVITDSNTGIEYLAITGCGTTEMRSVPQGKTHITKEE